MKTRPCHQPLTSRERFLATKVVNLVYPLISYGVTRAQQMSLARKAVPELPEFLRELSVINAKACYIQARQKVISKINRICRQTAIKRATRDVCRYPPTSDDLDPNNNDNFTSKERDPDTTNTSADNVERLPIELLSQTDMDISGKLDDFNKSSPPDITGGPESSQLEERREEFRQYPLDKIRQNYTVKKATSSTAATIAMTATGTSSIQQPTGTVSGQPPHIDVEVTAPTTIPESANNDDMMEQPAEHHRSHGQRLYKRKRDQTTPTTSPYGSAIDTRPDEHPTQSVDGSSAQAEHLTSTPPRTKIPLTNDPVVKRRAETYQRTNVSTPAYEEHGTPAFQGLFSEATIDEQHPSSEAYQSNKRRRSRQYYRPPLAKHDDDDRDEKEQFAARMNRWFQELLRRENGSRDDQARREEQVREGTSESCSNHGSDWNDRDERTSRNRDQSEGRSTTFYRGTNWFRGYRARRGGRDRFHSRGAVARPNRVTDWRRDVHEGHEREGSSTVCHGRANSTHARRRF